MAFRSRNDTRAVELSLPEYIEKYSEVEPGTHLETELVSVAGIAFARSLLFLMPVCLSQAAC